MQSATTHWASPEYLPSTDGGEDVATFSCASAAPERSVAAILVLSLGTMELYNFRVRTLSFDH